jgi:hypothetical protein
MHHSDSRAEIKPLPLPFHPAIKWRCLVDDAAAAAQGHVDRAWPYDTPSAQSAFKAAQELLRLLHLAGDIILLLEGLERRQLAAVPTGHFVTVSGDVVRLPTKGDLVQVQSPFARGMMVTAPVSDCRPSDRPLSYLFWAGNMIFSARDHGRRWRWPELGGGR